MEAKCGVFVQNLRSDLEFVIFQRAHLRNSPEPSVRCDGGMAVLNERMKFGAPSLSEYPKAVPNSQTFALNKINIVNGSGNDEAMKRLAIVLPEVGRRLSLSLRHAPFPERRSLIHGLFLSSNDGTRNYSFRLSIPLFQMKYNEDFSKLTYYLLKIPIFWRIVGCQAGLGNKGELNEQTKNQTSVEQN